MQIGHGWRQHGGNGKPSPAGSGGATRPLAADEPSLEAIRQQIDTEYGEPIQARRSPPEIIWDGDDDDLDPATLRKVADARRQLRSQAKRSWAGPAAAAGCAIGTFLLVMMLRPASPPDTHPATPIPAPPGPGVGRPAISPALPLEAPVGRRSPEVEPAKPLEPARVAPAESRVPALTAAPSDASPAAPTPVELAPRATPPPAPTRAPAAGPSASAGRSPKRLDGTAQSDPKAASARSAALAKRAPKAPPADDSVPAPRRFGPEPGAASPRPK